MTLQAVMHIIEMGATLIGGIAHWRRDVLAYAICAGLAIGAAVLGAWACVLALEPLVGAVYSRLIVGGAFAVCAAGVAIAMRVMRRSHSSTILRQVSEGTLPSSPQVAQTAMIVEAVLLGYALSRRFDRR